MRILVVNCNTSSKTTEAIYVAARAAARLDTHVAAVQPSWGVESAEGYLDSFISAAAVLDVVSSSADGYDAVVLAGYGEHGREGVRQLLSVPVVDITEAAAQLACLVGHRFGVVTSLASTVAGIWDSLLIAGLHSRCVGVVAAGIPVLDLGEEETEVAEKVALKARDLARAGADVIVLGCAGMAGVDALVEQILDMPVIEGVGAGVVLAESLVRLGKSTSKAGPYAPASVVKVRPGWPVSSRSGVPAGLPD